MGVVSIDTSTGKPYSSARLFRFVGCILIFFLQNIPLLEIFTFYFTQPVASDLLESFFKFYFNRFPVLSKL